MKAKFLAEDEKDSTKHFKRLANDFAAPLREVHVASFTEDLPIFTNYSKFLKSNDLFPHNVLHMTKSFARKIAERFLRDKLQSDITISLIENQDNYVLLKDVFIGLITKSKLNDFLENGDISAL